MKSNYNDQEILNFYYNKMLPSFEDMIKNQFAFRFELIIRPQCNQNCNYCYISNYGKLLYPESYKVKKEEILNNTEKLLSYFLKNNKYIPYLDIFAGDLFFDNLFFDLIKIIYNYYQNIYLKIPNFDQIVKDKMINYPIIAIPSNFSFVYDQEKVDKTQYWIDKFKKDFNIFLYFSWSSDGYYAISSREKNTIKENYFDKCFKFCAKNNFGTHPMIAACNIDTWKQNYDWWISKYKEYNIENMNSLLGQMPSMLEVRNDDWTQDKIEKYVDFLDYVFYQRKKEFNNDIEKLSLHLLLKTNNNILKKFKIARYQNQDPIKMNYQTPNALSFNTLTCSIGNVLAIDVATLEIVGCHRTCYPPYRAGKFIFEKDQNKLQVLDGFNAYLNLSLFNCNTAILCNSCQEKDFCMKMCLGAQYESNGDFFIPCHTVCNLFKAKYKKLRQLYNENGIFNYVLEDQKYFEPYLKKLIIKQKEIATNE